MRRPAIEESCSAADKRPPTSHARAYILFDFHSSSTCKAELPNRRPLGCSHFDSQAFNHPRQQGRDLLGRTAMPTSIRQLAASVALIFTFITACAALPQEAAPSPTGSDSSSGAKSKWPKSKQVGIIVGCIVGGAIILFLWGWLLKGRKMFQGSKILFLRSHLSWSEESRQAARKERVERKRLRREEIERIWGKQRAGARTEAAPAQPTDVKHEVDQPQKPTDARLDP